MSGEKPVGEMAYEARVTKRIAELEAENEWLRAALANLVRINEEHNEAVAAVIGKHPDWKDTYLDEARAALRGEVES